jgi:hypothetical protein
LERSDVIAGFPPFTGDRADPFFRFSDAGLHQRCLTANEPLAREHLQLFEAMARAQTRRCSVCTDLITALDDHFSSGRLVPFADPRAASVNFVVAHRACLPRVKELALIEGVARELATPDRWPELERTSALLTAALRTAREG